jgi:predicted nucleotidyltransferase
MAEAHAEIVRIGYIGSYARGDWGPGSDVDVIILVAASKEPPIRRAAAWDALDLPVPADLFVYTLEEWEKLQSTRFGEVVEREAVWVYQRGGEGSHVESESGK